MSWSSEELESLASLDSATSELARELLALRKQTALDRQSREASQAEFARLNRERNKALFERDQFMGLAQMTTELNKELGADLVAAKERIGNLLGEIAATAIAAGMMDSERRGSLDGPNAILFLRQIKAEYEARRD